MNFIKRIRKFIALTAVVSSIIVVSLCVFSIIDRIYAVIAICVFCPIFLMFSDQLKGVVKGSKSFSAKKTDSSIKETSKLISNAKDKIFIVSGHLIQSFWSSDILLRSIREAVGRGVDIRVSTVHGIDNIKNHPLIKLSKENNKFRVGILSEPKNRNYIRHCMVVDGKHVRLEPREFHFSKFIKYAYLSLLAFFAGMTADTSKERINCILYDTIYLGKKKEKYFLQVIWPNTNEI